MQVVKILSSGILLTFGGVFLLLSLVLAFEKDPSQKDKNAFAGGLILGLPATVLGGLLARNVYQSSQRKSRDHLQTTFFQVLRAGNGRISPLAFAMAANISGEEARAYLDARAKEFFGNFEVDNEGGIFYCFDLNGLPGGEATVLPPLNAVNGQPTGKWEVVLYSFPASQKIATLKIVRDLTGLGLKASKDMIESTPHRIAQGVSREQAYQFKQKLESIGAIVSIAEK
ncbi:MAG: ribosomal protein L7/L12 [Leptolyngbyaceae cyanobacterium bins.59]|nr:ribosomal protein L7/L12 [Leptolyngbyaceae cyanobacterium bins.59]